MIAFTTGLPRTGSTLLHQILNQNPDIYASSTSPLLDLIHNTRNIIPNIPEFQAIETDKDTLKKGIFLGLINGYYSALTNRGVVIDKNRGWLSEIELLCDIIDNPKFIVTIRDMRDILASWEMVQRRNTLNPKAISPQLLTIEGRLQHYTSGAEVIGSNFNRIRDALDRGHRSKLHFVKYENLLKHPQETLNSIYNFLSLPPFVHDFNNIKSHVIENDTPYNLGNLHNINPILQPYKSKWQDILGEYGKKYYVNWDEIIG